MSAAVVSAINATQATTCFAFRLLNSS